MTTKFHVAVVIYQSTSDSKEYKPMYEESIALIKAATETEARKKVEALANSRCATFKNQKGEEITWSLYKITDVNAMLEDDIGDVTEIYSRHFNDINAYKIFDKLA